MRAVASLSLSLALVLLAGCGQGMTDEAETIINPDDKSDSGWVAADTFEVGAVVRGEIQKVPTYGWEDLATSSTTQAKLVDAQLKFIKNTAEADGWRFNQLADQVAISRVTTDGNVVTIEYQAVVDMLGRFSGREPRLEDLDDRLFTATVPLNPDGFSYTDIQGCAEGDEGHSVAAYNFHYYFTPDKEGCAIPMTEVQVEITEVFNRPTVYPEYDQLMQDLGDGKVGFTAALVPNTGDDDPLSRFNAHAVALERDLGLVGERSEDETYVRYLLDDGDVRIVIDLYDPTKVDWSLGFAGSFRQRLGEYTLIHYNGHSSYGTTHLLDEPESFTDAYQIIVMHSCQSYAYYTRQVFRAKATAADPSGFALADVVATGMSSYPSGAPPVARVLLRDLMDGMVAIRQGTPGEATSWLQIARSMEAATWGDIMYGIAGARTNAWQPPSE